MKPCQAISFEKLSPYLSTNLIRVYVICFLLALSAVSSASWPRTDADFAILPQYCKARLQGEKYPSLEKKWKSILGRSGFLHLHHYCAGLFDIYKSQQSFPINKGLLHSALSEFEYVDKNWNRNVILRPEMLVKRGEVYILLGHPEKAISNFISATKTKPDYSIPYVKMADYFLSVNNPSQAKKWLVLGSKRAPKSKLIKKRLMRLESQSNKE